MVIANAAFLFLNVKADQRSSVWVAPRTNCISILFGGQKLGAVEIEKNIMFTSKICSDFSSVGVKPNRRNHRRGCLSGRVCVLLFLLQISFL